MTQNTETIKVKSTDPESQGPFVVINKADFDPAVHVEYVEAEAPAAPAAAGGKVDDEDDASSMKVGEIRAALLAKGVQFDPALKKPQLLALLNAQPAA